MIAQHSTSLFLMMPGYKYRTGAMGIGDMTLQSALFESRFWMQIHLLYPYMNFTCHFKFFKYRVSSTTSYRKDVGTAGLLLSRSALIQFAIFSSNYLLYSKVASRYLYLFGHKEKRYWYLWLSHYGIR